MNPITKSLPEGWTVLAIAAALPLLAIFGLAPADPPPEPVYREVRLAPIEPPPVDGPEPAPEGR